MPHVLVIEEISSHRWIAVKPGKDSFAGFHDMLSWSAPYVGDLLWKTAQHFGLCCEANDLHLPHPAQGYGYSLTVMADGVSLLSANYDSVICHAAFDNCDIAVLLNAAVQIYNGRIKLRVLVLQ